MNYLYALLFTSARLLRSRTIATARQVRLFSIGTCALLAGCSTPSTQIIVHSVVTDAGRALSRPSVEHPARCALGSGGYHEWGGVRAGERPVKLSEIEPMIRAALSINGYEGIRRGESPDLVIEFYWGCMRPQHGLAVNGGPAILNLDDMLDLVGDRMTEFNRDRWSLRAALFEAAVEDRYFLMVSAFEPLAYARNQKLLLWRTQVSLPSGTLAQQPAFAVLAACGANSFGRATAEPRFITVDVEGTLRAVHEQIRKSELPWAK